MDNLKKIELILEELKEQIIYLVDQGQLNNVDFFMEQYIKLSPHSIERYSLEALIYMGKEDLEGAQEVLQEGLNYHPMSFDLLYNLGHMLQESEEIVEAYHIYMKAKYVASGEERDDINQALKGLVEDFKGFTKVDEENIIDTVIAGKFNIELVTKHEDLLNRKELLHTIATHMDRDSTNVLEIGFEDGSVSKNLQFFGYDVTAVDPVKEKIITVIIKEWHDNILQPEQETARFYQEEINLEWLKNIPSFDTIIAIATGNLKRFDANKEQQKEILDQLLKKVKNQIIIRVSVDASSVEFTKEDLIEVVDSENLELKTIDTQENEDGKFEICLVERKKDIKHFSIPKAIEAQDSASIVVNVELSKCRDMYGAGYIDDFHPFVEVLKEYENNPKLKYENSILKDYYETFQPKNLEEGLFGSKRKVAKLRQGWIGFPWNYDKEQKLIFTKQLKDTRPGGNHQIGPNTLEFGQGELRRLAGLYESIKKQGYHPEMFADGYISGYLLIKGDDYRFVVTEGQHRIATLAALGYSDILCKFSQRLEYPRIVDLDNVKKWPQVENKVYSRNLATRVFWRFFEEDVGRDRMNFK